jgi:hypothetical protein
VTTSREQTFIYTMPLQFHPTFKSSLKALLSFRLERVDRVSDQGRRANETAGVGALR